jgi:hypothetical protein
VRGAVGAEERQALQNAILRLLALPTES